ncbi:hypothetical protein [Phreatobacter sp.]|uniref:hypothetical protein n=1 Tax=Phreatobacter sp. TaxID=1966341 RepID=UPI003F6E7389
MSWAASAWAMKAARQAGRAMSPALRFLLVCVADRTNDDTGYTFASPRCLSDDVGNTVESIKTGLRRLEAMGYLARVRRLKPDGSHDTSLIILLRDAECLAKAEALGWTRPDEAALDEDAAGAPEPDGETQDVGGWGKMDPYPPKQGVGENGPGGWGKTDPHPIDEPEKLTSSPQPPSRTSREAPPSAHQPLGLVPAGLPARALPDGFDPDRAGADAFLAGWEPKTAADLPVVVHRLWAALSAEERRQASGRLADWRAQMRREGRRLGSASGYLRDRKWQVLDLLRAGRRDGTAAAVFWVRVGSEEWLAWERHEARHGRRLVGFPSKHESGTGRHMPSLWPPREAAGHQRPEAGGFAEAVEAAERWGGR